MLLAGGSGRRRIKEMQNVLEAETKVTLALGSSCLVSLDAPQVASPRETVEEGQHHHGKEPFEFGRVRQMGALEIEPFLLQVPEEPLDSPALTVESQGFITLKAIADDEQVRVAPILLHALAGKEQIQPLASIDALTASGFATSAAGVFFRQSPADDGVLLDAHDIPHRFAIQPTEPLLADELAVHGKDSNLLCGNQGEELLGQCDPLGGVGVPTLGLAGQDLPNQRNGHLPDHDGDDQEVDVVASELPVGSIHREDVSTGRLGKACKDEPGYGWQTQHKAQEEVLKAPIPALLGAVLAVVGGRKDHQIDGAVADHCNDQQAKTLEAGAVAVQLRFEGLDELGSKHPNFEGPSSASSFSRCFSLNIS